MRSICHLFNYLRRHLPARFHPRLLRPQCRGTQQHRPLSLSWTSVLLCQCVHIISFFLNFFSLAHLTTDSLENLSFFYLNVFPLRSTLMSCLRERPRTQEYSTSNENITKKKKFKLRITAKNHRRPKNLTREY